MKTPEDEAFEDIERRQGGFQAKRAAAADKVHEYVPLVEIEYTLSMADIKEALAQPAQEDEEVCPHCGSYCHERDELDKAEREIVRLQKLAAQPAQEPYAWTHTKIEGIIVFHRPADLDRHPDRWEALYKAPQQRPWVGLTDGEIKAMDAGVTSNSSFYAGALWAEAKLKEKNA